MSLEKQSEQEVDRPVTKISNNVNRRRAGGKQLTTTEFKISAFFGTPRRGREFSQDTLVYVPNNWTLRLPYRADIELYGCFQYHWGGSTGLNVIHIWKIALGFVSQQQTRLPY
ncbi:hypothetical protein J6590_049479 [Homalodisca vitripennis]|nr:hypothetical protein J6590_049479 [Homalodisca vitripennis]